MNTVTQDHTKSQDAPNAGAVGQPSQQLVERMPRGERIVMESKVPVLDTGMFDHMTRIAKLMASSSLVPEHLNAVRKVGGQEITIEEGEAIANCFLVVNQAVRWNMDPFAVAQHTYVHKGKLGYEGKLVAAVINTHRRIIKALSYRYEGEIGKPNRKVTVTSRLSGEDEDREISGSVADWKTGNDQWTGDADQILSYRGAREWARRHLPEAILGVLGDDELERFTTSGARLPSDQQNPPQHQKRGAAGLARALSGGAADATDATIVDAPAGERQAASAGVQAAPEGATDEPKKKPEGTLEQRNAIVAKFQQCKDSEILSLAADEARDYSWSTADQAVLNDAFNKRRGELEKT